MTIGIIILAALTGVVEGQTPRVVGEELQETERILANEGNKEPQEFRSRRLQGSATLCPETHPYVFRKGKYCCRTDKDRSGNELTLLSRDCEGRDSTRCSARPCRSAGEKKACFCLRIVMWDVCAEGKTYPGLCSARCELGKDVNYTDGACAESLEFAPPGQPGVETGSIPKDFIVMSNNYKTICGIFDDITNAQTCKDAALQLEVDFDNTTFINNKIPSGCIVNQGKGGKLHEVYWNDANAKDVTLKYDTGFRVVCNRPPGPDEIAFGR